ncbi:hypothetical protein N7527_007237 [Penicillium freii]|uniref:Uncharacterized protein n=1 Tax=Penicillium freii TaxID=48697 RepID=A0A117NKK1_PENFR|nr:hypothetical protein N7527_007237 [Penicillium freii]KUM56213.1 hypothetical protein ACN42_g11009 [Penicillium freii]
MHSIFFLGSTSSKKARTRGTVTSLASCRSVKNTFSPSIFLDLKITLGISHIVQTASRITVTSAPPPSAGLNASTDANIPPIIHLSHTITLRPWFWRG